MRKRIYFWLFLYFLGAGATETPPIVNIWVEGNSHISEEEILKAAEISVGMPYDATVLHKAMDRIYDMGYFLTKPEFVPFPGPEGVQIEIRVEEYPLISSIEFLHLISLPAEKLKTVMQLREGKIFNSRTMEEDVKRINEEFEKAGYLASQVVKSGIDPKTGKLEIEILEATIERIEIRGNEKTRPWVITTLMDTKPGEVLNVGKVFGDMYRVYGLGIFEEPPKWKVEEGSRPDALVLVIEIVEAKTGRLDFGAGYSENAGFLFTLSVSENNFRGKAQTILISGSTGARANEFSLLFRNPLWGKKREEFTLSLQRTVTLLNLRQESGELSQYNSLETGGRVSYRKPLNSRWSLSFSLQSHRQELNLERGNPVPPEVFARQGFATGQVNAFSYSLIRSTRLDIIDPFNGSYQGFEHTIGVKWLNGDFSYDKFVLDLRRYWSLRKKHDWVFAIRLKGGIATENPPVSEQFFLGGSETIRGYDWGWQRGTKMGMANVEIRWRNMPIGAVLFYDIGSAAPKDQKFTLEKKISSIGVGLRFKVRALGAFPIRLDIGYSLERKSTRGHFSFGQLF